MGKPRLALLFGAGAEVAYGMPSGGRFALEIFRRGSQKEKESFKAMRNKVNNRSEYARTWLPKDYETKRVSAFGRSNYESLLRSSLEEKRHEITRFFIEFDRHADRIKQSMPVNVDEAFNRLTMGTFQRETYENAIRLSDFLTMHVPGINNVFASKYFSGFLGIIETNEGEVSQEIRSIVRAMLELILGCCGEELARHLNEGIFVRRPDTIDLFDDLNDLFVVNYQAAGLSGLQYLFSTKPRRLKENSDSLDVVIEFGRRLLEELFSRALDYQMLIDSHFKFLYTPKSNWSKFCMICIFLQTVRAYITDIANEVKKGIQEKEGYYHDLHEVSKYFDIVAIGTTNYNNLIREVYDQGPKPCHLHGSVDEYYDPYLNKILSEEEARNSSHIVVPLLFTQSGIKPMTSVQMLKRYTDLYDQFKSADVICTVGFGFNADDGHINGMLRALVEEEDKQLVILTYDRDAQSKQDYQTKLRLECDANLCVLKVDDNRLVDQKRWYEALNDVVASTRSAALAPTT